MKTKALINKIIICFLSSIIIYTTTFVQPTAKAVVPLAVGAAGSTSIGSYVIGALGIGAGTTFLADQFSDDVNNLAELDKSIKNSWDSLSDTVKSKVTGLVVNAVAAGQNYVTLDESVRSDLIAPVTKALASTYKTHTPTIRSTINSSGYRFIVPSAVTGENVFYIMLNSLEFVAVNYIALKNYETSSLEMLYLPNLSTVSPSKFNYSNGAMSWSSGSQYIKLDASKLQGFPEGSTGIQKRQILIDNPSMILSVLNATYADKPIRFMINSADYYNFALDQIASQSITADFINQQSKIYFPTSVASGSVYGKTLEATLDLPVGTIVEWNPTVAQWMSIPTTANPVQEAIDAGLADVYLGNPPTVRTIDGVKVPSYADPITGDIVNPFVGTVPNVANPPLEGEIPGGSTPTTTPQDTANKWKQLVTTKFPFSLPWDLMLILSFLNADPKTPRFEIDETFNGYPFQFEVDMSWLDPYAPWFRGFIILGFAFMLVLITRRILGGAQ